MCIKITDIPEKIIKEYKMQEIVTEDGYVYCKIQKGMYGLPQAGIIAQELLQEHLTKLGYHQSKIIQGLWMHKTRKICFTLVVDNFAIKYTKLEDAQHLIDVIKKDYTITINWRNKIHQTYHQVRLRKKKGTCSHARILTKSPATIQPSATKEEAELTIPTRCTPIWS